MRSRLEEAVLKLEPPFYLVDLDALRAREAAIRQAFAARFDDFVLAYSYKTNYWPSITRGLDRLGVWAEVVSGLELQLALGFGVAPDRVIFNGPIKQGDVLADALDRGVLVHADSLQEVERIASFASTRRDKELRIGLRVNVAHPEGEAHRARSRFGLSLDEIETAARMLADAGSPATGLHAHLATKARSLEHFSELARELGEAAKIIGPDALDWIDVGGGLGFTPADLDGREYPTFDAYAEGIRAALRNADARLTRCRLIVEPGMAMVNDVVRFVTRVETTKQNAGRRLAFLDASVHTVKPTRHGTNLPTRVFDSNGTPKETDPVPWDLVGYTCMDDDFIAVDQSLPLLEPGDRLEIRHVGAYTYVFKPPFIRETPAVWAVEGDTLRLDVRAQDVDDFRARFVDDRDTSR